MRYLLSSEHLILPDTNRLDESPPHLFTSNYLTSPFTYKVF